METLRNRIGLRQVDVSKECGVNASMLSQWMLGRYKGNIGRVRAPRTACRVCARACVVYWCLCVLLLLLWVQINGLMESWLIRRRGGKPMEKGSMNAMRAYRVS